MGRPMRVLAVSFLATLLAACASVPSTPPPSGLFNDRLFQPATERVSAEDVFALSDEMKRYLRVDIAADLRSKGARQGLADAIGKSGQLRLDYDSIKTRNAAEAFAARSGNCLSLVIMTAAFAKALELPVRFQNVYAEETVSRTGDMQFFIGHVNLTLGEKVIYVGPGRASHDLLTIDFLPPRESLAVSTRPVSEEAIVAMYMNNRAAELLVQGQLDRAYWWARGAVEADPRFLSAVNTLGLIYQRRGAFDSAERAFAYALERERGNTRVMSNLARLFERMGRADEARILNARLESLEPHPPFSYFNLGMQALREGNPEAAKELFSKEVDRVPYYHEFRFWLGVAYLNLGDTARARKELALAVEYAPTRDQHDLYAAKLDRIRASHLQQ